MGVAARHPPAGREQQFPLQDAAGIRGGRRDGDPLAAQRVDDDVRYGGVFS
jgi:hypothetical protein